MTESDLAGLKIGDRVVTFGILGYELRRGPNENSIVHVPSGTRGIVAVVVEGTLTNSTWRIGVDFEDRKRARPVFVCGDDIRRVSVLELLAEVADES